MANPKKGGARIAPVAKAGRRAGAGKQAGRNHDNMPSLFERTYVPAQPLNTKVFVVTGDQPALVEMFHNSQRRLKLRNVTARAA